MLLSRSVLVVRRSVSPWQYLSRGLVEPSGLDAIAQAKSDGSWTKLDAVDALVVPDDLVTALDESPPARASFDAFPPSTRRGILEWISQARTTQTRDKRIDDTARRAAVNERVNQWPRR